MQTKYCKVIRSQGNKCQPSLFNAHGGIWDRKGDDFSTLSCSTFNLGQEAP